MCIAYDTKIPEYSKLMNKLGKGIEGFVVTSRDVSTDLMLKF